MPRHMLNKATMFAAVVLFSTSAAATIVTDWNNAALAEVRASKLGPPMVARALAIAHTCMYDAWAAYDKDAVGTVLGGSLRRPANERRNANKAQAISFAAYRCLVNLFPAGASRLAVVMVSHGYDPTNNSTDQTTPAGIGNVAAQAVIDARRDDGSNQYGNLTPVPCVAQTYPWTTVTVMQLGDAPAELQPLPCVGPGGAATGPYADYDDVAAGYSHYVPSNPLMGFCTPLLAVCPGWPDFFDPFIDPSLPWPDIADPNHWQPLVFSCQADVRRRPLGEGHALRADLG
jgi:hypothetical protein